MPKNTLSKNKNMRNTSLDIIRIVAVFSVVSVHFFLHNGFYSETVQGLPMYIMSLMRTLFTVCVPLFLILTGYLMSKKTLSKKFYLGITKTITIFVLASLFCMAYKAIFEGTQYTFKTVILGIFDFTGANYSWYIEMYIGLFLLIPFLNLAYNKLNSQKHKQILVFTLVLITILPSAFNIFNFETLNWWATPTMSDTFQKILPAFWIGMYPLSFYFTGAYFREYGMKLKTKPMLVLFLATVVIFGSFNFYRSYGTTFKSGMYIYWYGIESYVLASLLFVLLSRINTEKMSAPGKSILKKISELALGIYLMSYVFDEYLYDILNTNVPTMTDRLPYYFIMVPAVFIGAAIFSEILSILQVLIHKGISLIYNKIKNNLEYIKSIKVQDVVFFSLLIVAMIFAFWKCVFGFGGNDEAFYLTIPHRIGLGDSFLTDEWHLSQLSGFLLLPFVSLFRAITGSMDGILLTARILYVIMHAFVASVIYLRLRKYRYSAVAASILFFIFTPFDIMALSYNTMGLDLVALTGVLLATANFNNKAVLIVSGLTFAGAVLCCPYLIIAYLIYFVCVIINIFIQNKNKKNSEYIKKNTLFSLRTFVFFTIGAAILAVIFIVFVISRANLSDIFNNLPYLLSDPEHPQIAMNDRIGKYFASIYNCHPQFFIALISYIIMAFAMLVDKKRKNHRSIYLIITLCIVSFCMLLYLPTMTSVYYNAIMFPLIFLGITSFVLCDKKLKTMFASLFIIGILYSFAICFSSNQYFYVIANAISISNIASIIFAGELVKELTKRPDEITYKPLMQKMSIIFVVLIIVLQGIFQISVKAVHCFWDSDTSALNAKITDGPAKGIITSAQNKANYELTYQDIQYYNDKEPGNILLFTQSTWTYLALNDFSYGTYSAWLSNADDSTAKRLSEYFSINKNKTPKYIYVPKTTAANITNIKNTASEYGYNITENDLSYKLEKVK